MTEQAVGVQIAGTLKPALPYDGGHSFDVFLAANGAAILDEAPNLAESGAITFALGALSIPLATQSLMTTLSAGEALAGAQAPPGVLYDLVARAFSDSLNDSISNGTIAGTPNAFGGDIYSDGSWYSSNNPIMLGLNDVPTLTPSTDNVATLNAERAYRLAEWGATGDGNPDLGGPGEVEQ